MTGAVLARTTTFPSVQTLLEQVDGIRYFSTRRAFDASVDDMSNPSSNGLVQDARVLMIDAVKNDAERLRNRADLQPDPEEGLQPSPADIEDFERWKGAVQAAEQSERIRDAVESAGLTKRERAVIDCCAESKTIAETAAKLGVTAMAAKKALARARKKLRQAVKNS